MARADGMEETLQVARRIAREAGQLLRRRWNRPRKVSCKSSAIDLVTDADRASETLILKRLRRAFPGHAILAEERRGRRFLRPELEWIVDPLDGTTNWVHGFPHVAVSIALRKAEQVELGVVYDPLRRELFAGVRGRGAWLNGRRIRVSATRNLRDALLGSGFPYDCRKKADFYLTFVRAFLERSRGFRRTGSAALDLCYVACGRLDGFWEWYLKPWDTAAGGLIVQEAGGCLSDFLGRPHRLSGGQTLAANPFLHQQMVAVLRRLLYALGSNTPMERPQKPVRRAALTHPSAYGSRTGKPPW